jgi:MarR family transcriptional regulator, lower aerobic nicotinate degradation pathway regulator
MMDRFMGAHVSAFSSDVRAALDGFRRIIQALRLFSGEAERRVGLSTAQLFALQQLAGRSGASVNDLAASTFTHQSSVSVVVQRLVERKLVAKVTSDDDRRRVHLAVTDAGRALLRRSPEPAQDRLIAGIAALSAAERQALVHALTSIADTLCTRGGPPPMIFEERKRLRRATPARAPRGRSVRARRV